MNTKRNTTENKAAAESKQTHFPEPTPYQMFHNAIDALSEAVEERKMGDRRQSEVDIASNRERRIKDRRSV